MLRHPYTPMHGCEVNNLIVDILNDYGLKQWVNSPTGNNNTLDLVLTTQPNTVYTVWNSSSPWDFRSQAVIFQLYQIHSKVPTKNYHKIYQYHKANTEDIHRELLEFQSTFISNDPYTLPIEENWSTFKQKISEILDKHVPSKTTHSSKHFPWLNNFIKCKMKERKKLYDRARRTQDVGDWDSYKITKNHVDSIIKTAYNKYCSHIFDSSFSINRKWFWSLVKAMRKDTTEVSSLWELLHKLHQKIMRMH